MKEKYNILILEDETIASHYLKQLLLLLGEHNILEATNANDALEIVENTHINFAFVDININGAMDGINCARLMNEKYFLPIIYTTAYDDSLTIQEASKTNMFGYLIKPFNRQSVESVFHVAINRILDRAPIVSKPQIPLLNQEIQLSKSHHFSLASQTLFMEGIPVSLTKKELAILSVLSVNLNQNISFETIQEKVWGEKEISNITIRDIIRRLRFKSPELDIQSVAGFGYILKVLI